MSASIFAALLNSAFLMLRLGGTGSFPRPLSAEEERKCVELARSGDPSARSTLIEHNLRLVAHIIKKYYSATCDQDDLISIGTIGLIKGISSYKPEKGVRLATYASRCVENAILTQRRHGFPRSVIASFFRRRKAVRGGNIRSHRQDHRKGKCGRSLRPIRLF